MTTRAMCVYMYIYIYIYIYIYTHVCASCRWLCAGSHVVPFDLSIHARRKRYFGATVACSWRRPDGRLFAPGARVRTKVIQRFRACGEGECEQLEWLTRDLVRFSDLLINCEEAFGFQLIFKSSTCFLSWVKILLTIFFVWCLNHKVEYDN